MNFIQIEDIDDSDSAALIRLAIGSERTMQQFANVCKVETSTISRVVNHKNLGASKIDLLIKVIENASEESDITLQDLLEAQGLVNEVDYKRIKKIKENHRKLINKAMDVVKDNLSNHPRGECVKCSFDERIVEGSVHTYDFEFHEFINGEVPRYNNEFIVIPHLFNSQPYESNRFEGFYEVEEFRRKKYLNYFYERMAEINMYYLSGENESWKRISDKITFLTDEEDIYQLFLSTYEGFKVAGDISILLTDYENKKFLEEKKLEKIKEAYSGRKHDLIVLN